MSERKRPNVLIRMWRWIFRTHWKEPVKRLQESWVLLKAENESDSEGIKILDIAIERLQADQMKLKETVQADREARNTLEIRQRQLTDFQRETAELGAKRYHEFENDFRKSIAPGGSFWKMLMETVQKMVTRAVKASEERLLGLLAKASEQLIERLVMQEFERRFPTDPLIQKLQFILVKLGQKAEDLAAHCDVSLPTARKWIAGTQPPCDKHRRMIAELVYNTKIPTVEQLAGTAPLPGHADPLIDKLHKFLHAPDVNDEETASKIGVCARSMYQWMAGDATPTTTSRKKVAAFLYRTTVKKLTSDQLSGLVPLPGEQN